MSVSLENFFAYLEKDRGVTLPEDLVRGSQQPYFSSENAIGFLEGARDRLITQIPKEDNQRILEINTLFDCKIALIPKENPFAANLEELVHYDFFFKTIQLGALADWFQRVKRIENLTLATLRRLALDPAAVRALTKVGIGLPNEINRENFKLLAELIQAKIEENLPRSKFLRTRLIKAFNYTQTIVNAQYRLRVQESKILVSGSVFVMTERLEALAFSTLKKLAPNDEIRTAEHLRRAVALLNHQIFHAHVSESEVFKEIWQDTFRSVQADRVSQHCLDEFQAVVQGPMKEICIQKGLRIPPQITRENILPINEQLCQGLKEPLEYYASDD